MSLLLRALGGIRNSTAYGATSQHSLRHDEVAAFVRREFERLDRNAALVRVLDVGCGNGQLLARLPPDVRELHGCDWLDEPAHNDRISYRRLDLNTDFLSAYVDNSFDVVLCSDVLEHLENPARMLREIGRVLKHDGFAVLSLPNSWNIFERVRYLFTAQLRRYLSERRSAQWGHISIFTRDTLESLCDRSALTIRTLAGGFAAFRGHVFPRNRSLLFSYCIYIVLVHRAQSTP